VFRYKALETTFYVVIALLPSLAVYEMVRGVGGGGRDEGN
jgi:hypothetical protein